MAFADEEISKKTQISKQVFHLQSKTKNRSVSRRHNLVHKSKACDTGVIHNLLIKSDHGLNLKFVIRIGPISQKWKHLAAAEDSLFAGGLVGRTIMRAWRLQWSKMVV